jgi:hypothetical protein
MRPRTRDAVAERRMLTLAIAGHRHVVDAYTHAAEEAKMRRLWDDVRVNLHLAGYHRRTLDGLEAQLNGGAAPTHSP